MTFTASLHSKNTSKGKQFYIRWREAGRQRHETIKGVYGKDALRIAAERKREIEQGRWYIAPPERLGTFLEGWLERQANHVKPVTLQRKRESLRALGVLETDKEVNRGQDRASVSGVRASEQALRGRGATQNVRGGAGRQRDRDAVRRGTPGHRDRSHNGHGSGLASTALDRLSVADVEDAHAALAARAPRQAQQALQTLKMALKDAERRGQRVDTALFEIKRNRYQSKEPRFLTWDEVLELQSWLPEHVCRIVPIAALTGAREGELFDLRESDLDLDKAVMRIRSGKTAASTRSVNLPTEAVRLFREQILARRHTEGGYVFPAPQGGRWQARNFMHRYFRPARRKAGLEGVPFHGLRHTYASLAIDAGVPISSIAGQLGHKDGGALLLRRYGHLYPGAGEAVAEALDAVVRGSDSSSVDEALSDSEDGS